MDSHAEPELMFSEPRKKANKVFQPNKLIQITDFLGQITIKPLHCLLTY